MSEPTLQEAIAQFEEDTKKAIAALQPHLGSVTMVGSALGGALVAIIAQAVEDA